MRFSDDEESNQKEHRNANCEGPQGAPDIVIRPSRQALIHNHGGRDSLPRSYENTTPRAEQPLVPTLPTCEPICSIF